MWSEGMEWLHLGGYVPLVDSYENGDEPLGLMENM